MMSRALVIALLIVLGFAVFLVIVSQLTDAFGQMVVPVACTNSLPCLRNRVKDLTDYREFVDDQLALAKALNESLSAQLQACRTPSDLPPRPEPEKP